MATGDFTRINTNISALNALNSLKNIQNQLGTAQLALSTGKRINSASDDPAGLTIATKFNYTASGLGVALNNIGDSKNMLAVAEGGLNEINTILQSMRDKTVQAASDTLGTTERSAIKQQLTDFANEINSIVNTTTWNGNKLLDGLQAFNGTITFQVGASTGGDNQITLTSSSFANMTVASLTLGPITSIDVSSASLATLTLGSIDASIASVSYSLQIEGSLVSRLNFRQDTVTVAQTNTQAAYSRIMDADMASMQLQATKLQILQQTATSMLAQANMAPQGLLKLFQ